MRARLRNISFTENRFTFDVVRHVFALGVHNPEYYVPLNSVWERKTPFKNAMISFRPQQTIDSRELRAHQICEGCKTTNFVRDDNTTGCRD